MLNALIDAGLVVTGSWPMHTERPGRLRAVASAALVSSIYMVCHKVERESLGFWNDIQPQIRGGGDFFISGLLTVSAPNLLRRYIAATVSAVINPPSQDLNIPIDDHDLWMVTLNPLDRPLQAGVDVARLIANGDEGNAGRLPEIVVIDLGRSQIELSSQAQQDRLEQPSFAFQRIIAGEMKFDTTGADYHSW